jgi:putative ABC transport system substrate-binding protein
LVIWGLSIGAVPISAQPSPYRAAVLTPGLAYAPALEGFREGLAQLGYTEGNNIAFMVEDSQGDVGSLARRAVNVVAAKPDLIFTLGTVTTAMSKQATTTLPIVFAFVADPLRSGLVASHASSRNNLTGIANHAAALSGKRLEILQEIVPDLKRVLVLVAPHENVSEMSFQDLAEVAPRLGIELARREVSTKEDIDQILQTFPKGSVDAIFQIPASVVGTQIDLLSQKAKAARLPLAASDSSMVERGALMSYGADFRLLGRQAAKLAVQIITGAKPSELPIQTPETLLLAVNMTTAQIIGLKIPRRVIERTDLVFE